MKKIILLLLLLFVSDSKANNFIVRRSCYSNYHVAPYVAPVQHVNQNYFYLLPHALPVEITRDYYFTVSDYYRDKWIEEKINNKFASLINYQNPQLINQNISQQQKEAIKTEVIKTEVPDGLQEYTNTACVRCHKTNNVGGRVDLTDLSTVPVGMRWQVHGLVTSNEMPKSGEKAKDEIVLKYFRWAKGVK